MLPLEGIRVLDLTRLLPGPFCSMVLADFGAEVIKVEDTLQGDYMRELGAKVKGVGWAYIMLNRNKKSLAINLKDPEGRDVFLELVRRSDVLMEGFRPGVMERLGLGYKDLSKINPRLVYCSISGYGQNGPYRDVVGHDINYISYAGVAGLTGNPDGPPGIPGVQLADVGGGSLWALVGILIGLMKRERYGQGDYVDVSMLDGVISFLPVVADLYFGEGERPSRGRGLLLGEYACYRIYETRDGKYVSLGALEDKFWSTFCRMVGKQELISLQYDRKKQQDVIAEVQNIFKQKTRDEWVEFFRGAEVCFAPVLEIDEVFEDPQVKARELLMEAEQPGIGLVRQLANPLKFAEMKPYIKSPAPSLGEHTEEILVSLGLASEAIERLKAKGVVRTAC